MSNEPLDELFKGDSPSVNELAKQRAKRAAMKAFRAEFKNKSKVDQGIEASDRLTLKQANERKGKMSLSTKKVWFGGLAACCVLTIGAMTLKPAFDDPRLVQGENVVPIASVYEKENQSVSEANDEVVVAGIRESLSKSLSVKRDVSSVADYEQADSGFVAIERELNESMATVASAPVEAYKSAPRAKVKRLGKGEKVSVALRQRAPAESRHLPMPVGELSPFPTPEDRNGFNRVNENTTQITALSPVSTFSIDVDTASYAFMRRQLSRGVLPARDSIRVEELVNYFDYQYPLPESKNTPFEPTIHVLDSPWAKGNKLVHIAIKGYDIPKSQQPDSNLVFLLDVSGSMGAPDRLPLVKQSMGLLLDTLKPTDTVAIVVYAGAAGAVLQPTKVKNKQAILNALNRLNAGGSTAGAAGLELAYQLAEQNFNKNLVNRIILATDGDFNVGVTKGERLEDYVQRKREAGVYLSVLGFGEGNYQDALMQTLAQNGNGIAVYIDTLSEAQKVLVHEATSSLFPIANDVKIQVEFNPKAVSEYRLIGYETRALKREDFNNDKVDAGDIGAGHSVTAIYEITPVGSLSARLDPLRYGGKAESIHNENASDKGLQEYGFLKIRYKLPGGKESKLISRSIAVDKEASTMTALLQREFNFASAVSGFAQILKGSQYTHDYGFDDVIKLAQANKGADTYGYRTEFIQLVRRAKISKSRP